MKQSQKVSSIGIIFVFMILCLLKKARRANILLIIIEDMGYYDLEFYGSRISTLNNDKITDEGIQFTQLYSSAIYCPTSASLLTGLHLQQVGHVMNIMATLPDLKNTSYPKNIIVTKYCQLRGNFYCQFFGTKKEIAQKQYLWCIKK